MTAAQTRKAKFPPGAKVRHKTHQKIGAVVPDILGSGVCDDNNVLVEFDGISQVSAISTTDLENLGMLCPVVNTQKCGSCVFFGGRECFRYHPQGRLQMLHQGNSYQRIPNRIYPFCQDEVCQ